MVYFFNLHTADWNGNSISNKTIRNTATVNLFICKQEISWGRRGFGSLTLSVWLPEESCCRRTEIKLLEINVCNKNLF